MLEAPALDETGLDQPKAPISSVRLTASSASHVSLQERLAEARRLVESAMHVLGTELREEPMGLRIARALVLSLLDELTMLDGRGSR